MGCGSSTEAMAQPPEAMAPSAWVLRRRERLQQQQQQQQRCSAGNDSVATAHGETELDFGFCVLPEDEGSSQAEVLGSPAPSTRGSEFALSLGPSSVVGLQATPVASLSAGRRPPTADGNPLRAGSRDRPASPSPASDVVVGDLLVATTPRQPPALPRAARVLRFSPMLRAQED